MSPKTNPGYMRRILIQWGFQPGVAGQLVDTRPDDVARWIEVGTIPEDEDPRK
jgi:hypothetical protein